MAGQNPWRPKYIVLDSTELRADIGLSSTRAVFLRAFCQRYGSVVVVPRVVRLELNNHLESEVPRLAESLVSTARKLERYGAQVPSELATTNRDQLVDDAKQRFAERLEWLGASDLPLPDVSHDEVAARLLAGSRPFGTEGKKDTGYRDFLLWRNVLSLDGPTAFVTSNRKDFMENEELHPDLARDIAVNGPDVRVFAGLESLTEKVLRPSFPTTDAPDILLILIRDDQRLKLERFAEARLAREDLLGLVSWLDVTKMSARDDGGGVAWAGDVETAEQFEVSRVDSVSLNHEPTDMRRIDGARVVAAYGGLIRYTVTRRVWLAGRVFQFAVSSLLDEQTPLLEFTLDVGGAEVVPATVSLVSM